MRQMFIELSSDSTLSNLYKKYNIAPQTHAIVLACEGGAKISIARSYDDIPFKEALLEIAMKVKQEGIILSNVLLQNDCSGQFVHHMEVWPRKIADSMYNLAERKQLRAAQARIAGSALRLYGAFNQDVINVVDSYIGVGRLIPELEEKTPNAEQGQASCAAPGSEQLLSRQGILKNGVQQIKKDLGFLVMELVEIIQIECRKFPNLEETAHISYAATTVSSLSKGEERYQNLCDNPSWQSIPDELFPVIKQYVASNPEVRELANHREFGNELKISLINSNGELGELHARFGEPEPKQDKSCVLM